MRWPPNPYAIAERLTGKVLTAGEGPSAADDLLRSVFNDKARQSFGRVGVNTLDDVLQFFAQISALYDKPITMAQALGHPLVQRVSDAYDADAVEKLLPYLLPISDVQFGSEQPASPNEPPRKLNAAYADTGPLVVTNVSYLDPMQGSANDCYLIAAMIALAWAAPLRLIRGLQSSGYDPPPSRQFTWQFHEDEDRIEPISARGRVPFENELPCYAKSDPPGEFWPSLTEKAYVLRAMKLRGRPAGEPETQDYKAIDNYIKPWRACRQMAGGRADFDSSGMDLYGRIFSPQSPVVLNTAGKTLVPVMAMTRLQVNEHNSAWEESGLHLNHAYAVLGKLPSTDHVVLRNPHGLSTIPREGYFDGQPWDCGEQDPVTFNRAGVFAIERALFNRYFEWAGWVRFSQG